MSNQETNMAKKTTTVPKDSIAYSEDEYKVVRGTGDDDATKFYVVPIKQDKVLRAVSYLNKNHSRAVSKLLEPMADLREGLAITVKMDVAFDVHFDYDDDNIRYNKTKKLKTYAEFDPYTIDFESKKVYKQIEASEAYKQAVAKLTAVRDNIIKGIEELLAKDTEVTHTLTPAQLNDVIQRLVII